MRRKIVKVQRAELLVDQRPRSGADRLQIEAPVFDDLLYLLRTRVITEERDRAMAVGEKVHGPAVPDRARVVGVVTGNFLDVESLEIHQPDRGRLAAAIALPCVLPLFEGHVRQPAAVVREAAL